jgi:N-acyl homoserine lactone hydrolase
MSTPASITITPVFVADLLAENERMPVYVHVIDHPDARVLVDTGMTELHPAVADLDPRLRPLTEQDLDLAGIDIVVNSHLHFDHCGGNHLFTGRPIYVQRRELDDARGEDGYTIREWVDAPGVRYVPVDGELELLPGLRLVPAPGHTRGMQVVVVETGARPVVVGGDVAGWFGELDKPHTEGQLRVRALDPELVWLAHEHEPWRPPMFKEFDAQLQKGDNPGAWTCVVVDDVAELFGTRGLVKIRGEIDGEPFDGALMAQGDGTHRLPVKASLRDTIGKQAGDTVHVRIDERIG